MEKLDIIMNVFFFVLLFPMVVFYGPRIARGREFTENSRPLSQVGLWLLLLVSALWRVLPESYDLGAGGPVFLVLRVANVVLHAAVLSVYVIGYVRFRRST